MGTGDLLKSETLTFGKSRLTETPPPNPVKTKSISFRPSTTNLMMKRQAVSTDRISTMPEPIIHRILSLLPTESIKLATSLSKTWYDLCSSFPYLDFDDDSFGTRYNEDITLHVSNEIDDRDPELEAVRETYLNYIGDTLHRFHERNPGILIHRIRIPITLINSRLVSLLDDWIRLALEHGVEKIDLKIRGIFYNLPWAVFASSSVREMKLKWCRSLETFHHDDISVSCSKLRKLDITSVNIDELALRSVISNCPLMEKLDIVDAIGLTNIRISRLHKLKSLRIYNDYDGTKMFEVDAPMLDCLEFSNGFDHPPCKIGILECPRLAKLSLHKVEVENFQLEFILSRIPVLGSLRLTDLVLLTKLKILKNSLKKLSIIRCTHLVELEINASNFLSFEFDSKSIPLMSPMHTIMGQSRITLHIRWEQSLFDNFRNFLSRLHHVNYLCIYLIVFGTISVDILEERVVQPVTNIEELKMVIMGIYKKKSLHCILYGLIWSCHPRIFTMRFDLFEKAGVMKFLGDIMVGVGACGSWLPYLEEIMFVDCNNNVIRLPMDGTVHSSALESYSRGEIKFVFKW